MIKIDEMLDNNNCNICLCSICDIFCDMPCKSHYSCDFPVTQCKKRKEYVLFKKDKHFKNNT